MRMLDGLGSYSGLGAVDVSVRVPVRLRGFSDGMGYPTFERRRATAVRPPGLHPCPAFFGLENIARPCRTRC